MKQPISFTETEGEFTSKLPAAIYVARSIESKSPNDQVEFIGEKRENKALEVHARSTGIWVEDYREKFNNEFIAAGVESEVFSHSSGKYVYKVNNGIQHGYWLDFFYRIVAHNKYFPEAGYSLFGFTKRDNLLAAILVQAVIDIQRSATPDEIKVDLEKRGFAYNHINDARDTDYGVILRDLHRENTVINLVNNIIYIDPIIQFEEGSRFIEECGVTV